MRSDYKRLGDYIREVDVRNRDLAVTNLLGVSVSKEFIPSIANTIGTDMFSYKVVRRGQFVYIADTSRRGDKIAIALLTDEKAIVSSIYTSFEVRDENELLPEYLMMWFRRPEFDRYARFKSHGSAREIFDWAEMCEVRLPIPSISRQRELVTRYETLTRRICLNETLITDLEVTAQTLYRHLFVDNIDPSHLPAGWRMGTLGEVAEVTSGKSCLDKVPQKDALHQIPVIGATGLIGYTSSYNQDCTLLTTGRVGTIGVVNRYSERIWTSDNVLVLKISDFYFEYCYQILSNFDYDGIIKGGVQNLITQTDLKDIECYIPPQSEIVKFNNGAIPMFKLRGILEKEVSVLKDLQSLALTQLVK